MLQWFKALINLTEGLDSIPRTHMETHRPSITPSSSDMTSFLTSMDTGHSCGAHTYR